MNGPMHVALKSGTRVFSDNRAKALHYSPRAINLQFDDRVVTLLNRDGILSPSSIVLDLASLPSMTYAEYHGDVLDTDRFRVKVTNFRDLHVSETLALGEESLAKAISQFIQPRRHSISIALLMLRGMPCALDGMEKAVAEKELSILKDGGSWSGLADKLLGLGFGLTPSGDDFMMGAISVLNLQGIDTSAVRSVVDSYANPFSRTILRNALDGYYIEPLGSLVKELALGTLNTSRILGLLKLGHTSGLDTLSGIYFALKGGIIEGQTGDSLGSAGLCSAPMTGAVHGRTVAE